MGWTGKVRRRYRNADNVIAKLGRNCAYCGRHATTVDHFVPWSVHKDNSDENLLPSCRRCNGIASDKSFETFEEKRLYILDRIAVKAHLVEVYCPNGCGVTYVRPGAKDRCPDCGEEL